MAAAKISELNRRRACATSSFRPDHIPLTHYSREFEEAFTLNVWGGRADLAPGHFTLVVESGRRIEQGRLREPLRDVLIRGDVLQTLSDIEGVGNDWHVSPEPMFCGKRGVVITGIAGPSVRLGHVEVFS